MRKILIGTFLAIAAIFITAGSGFDSTGNKPVSGLNAPKAQAEEEVHGPTSTLSPLQKEMLSLKQDGLCYYKTTAGDEWIHPEKYGFEATDTIYELFAFEQEFDANGNPKYTDIVVPREIDGGTVIDCNSFYNHYEIKSLRVKAAYSSWRVYSTQSYEEDYQGSRVSGCTNLEYYEMAEDTTSLNKWKLEGCNSLKTIVIPKGMKEIFANTFSRCKKPEKVIFKKFSNLEIIGGVKKIPWWRKQHTKKNGMVIYKNCLIDAGKREGTLTIRGNKIKKIMGNTFANSKAETIKVTGAPKLCTWTFDDCNAKKIILGKKINVIPYRCFGWNDNLKEIHILSKGEIIWGLDSYGNYQGLDVCTPKSQNLDIYVYSDKFHTESVKKWRCDERVTVHVPKKVLAKYRKYTKCKVVAL